jgi:hypothetical protein
LERRRKKGTYLRWMRRNGRCDTLSDDSAEKQKSSHFWLLWPTQKQDHYAVLGLGHLRYKATNDQIIVARMLRARLPSPLALAHLTNCYMQTVARCSVTTQTRRPEESQVPTMTTSSSASRRVRLSGGMSYHGMSHLIAFDGNSFRGVDEPGEEASVRLG